MHKTTRLQQTTIIFGYALFSLMLLAIILFTVIPFGKLFSTAVKPENVAYLLVSFVIGGLMPVFLAYVFGDRATHVKNKSSHHFNGVLFGVASYWTYGLFMNIHYRIPSPFSDGYDALAAHLYGLIPVAATLLVMGFVAIGYAKHQGKRQSVLEYKPYVAVLVGSFVLSLASAALYVQSDISTAVAFISVGLFVPLLVAVIGYVVLGKLGMKKTSRAAMAVVAMTVAYVSATLVSQYTAAILQYGGAEGVIGLFIGVVAWIAFLFLVRRTK